MFEIPLTSEQKREQEIARASALRILRPLGFSGPEAVKHALEVTGCRRIGAIR